jgi:aspartyl-tRNA(Asn)/glutamyl-tRNA(Gln) amidotransferase subunit A
MRALRIRSKLCRALDAFLEPFDAVLTVPTAGPATSADGSHSQPYGNKSLGGAGNVCGTPAIVVPTGLTNDGLPTSIQLDGRAWSENRLLAVATDFQQATSWHSERPNINAPA